MSFLYTGGPEGARTILSTIAGSMITVTGVVFSITIVALTLASSQFGPRLLRNFMQDRTNQVVLGIFIATFVYCLLILQSVSSIEETIFVPNISVSFSVALALINVGVLIHFIHHISTSIQAESVISSVNSEMLDNIQRLFPDEIGDEAEDREKESEEQRSNQNWIENAYRIESKTHGYLQAIDNEGLLEIAQENDLLIYLPHRPGEYIIKGNPLVLIEQSIESGGGVESSLINSFIIGPQRTPEQDAEFTIHQLVEVALRALSPGINDPFTAISCIDRLTSAICDLTHRAFPSPYRYDDDESLRIIAKAVTFEGIIDAAFDQIRQYGESSVAVTIRLLEALKTIADHSRVPEHKKVIYRQAEMIVRTSKLSNHGEKDKDDIQDRYQALLHTLGVKVK